MFCIGTGRHGNHFRRNYVAITGIHGMVHTGTGPHRKLPAATGHRGNWPPREFTGFFQSDHSLLPRKRPRWHFTGRERAAIFVGVFGLFNNQYVRERYLV